MFRTQIKWSAIPVAVHLRGRDAVAEPEAPRPHSGFPGGLPDLTGQVPKSAPPAPPPVDISPLLEQLAGAFNAIEKRRRQSMEELQQVAIELAVAAASHLAFKTIEAGECGVDQLVRQAVEQMGLDSPLRIALHPADLALLRQNRAAAEWLAETPRLGLQADPTVPRGGCRAENDNRSLVSDISLRLSEIRRHWMEELDDSQVERRRTQADSRSLRRFPDRRETA